jgi:hypothetical protein
MPAHSLRREPGISSASSRSGDLNRARKTKRSRVRNATIARLSSTCAATCHFQNEVFGRHRSLFTGVTHLLAARRESGEDTGSGLMSTMGGAVGLVGLVLLIWPGMGLVTISWLIALLALILSSFLIFVALHLERLKKLVDEVRSVL